MGCDIHPVVQVKENGLWIENPHAIFKNTWYKTYTDNEFEVFPSDNRNYRWFALLANVRNYSDLHYISEPKGLPDDFDPNIYLGDHSFSYLHVEDFETFDFANKIYTHTENITIEEYYNVRNTDKIPNNIGGIRWYGGIKYFTPLEADDFYNQKVLQFIYPMVVAYSWEESYLELYKTELSLWYEPMKILKEKYEDVRVVFGFDS